MGVENRYLLTPRDNTHRPEPSAIGRLIERRRCEEFAVRPIPPQHAAMNYTTGSTLYAAAATTGVSVQTADSLQSFGVGYSY